jgi:hypothetical protein
MIPPLADLFGMDAGVRSDLSDRLFPFDGIQGNLCLEGSVVCLSHTKHNTILPFVT